LLVSRRPHIK